MTSTEALQDQDAELRAEELLQLVRHLIAGMEPPKLIRLGQEIIGRIAEIPALMDLHTMLRARLAKLQADKAIPRHRPIDQGLPFDDQEPMAAGHRSGI